MKKSPAAPSHLSAAARAWWRKLAGEYEIEDAGGLLLLQTACEAFDRMKAAQDTVQKEGVTLIDRFGQTKAHPLLVVERDARSAMIMALKSLNLDLEPLTPKPSKVR